MNNLTVKEVNFHGIELLAIQRQGTGKIYAGINHILRGLGFDDRQIEYRRNKWNNDKVIAKGVQKFSYPSESRGLQEAYCIDIMKLPLALAKLEITPKMERDMPELSGKLEIYQDRCADALAEAFMPKKATTVSEKPTNNIQIPSPVNTAAKILKDTYMEAGVDPKFIAVAVNNLYKESTGYDSGIPLLAEEAHLYDKTAIAEKFGMCSKSGKPHPQAVGAIISKLKISAEECVNTPYNRNGHSGVDVQYKESVCGKVEDWLNCQGYPTEIISESGKKLNVTYK